MSKRKNKLKLIDSPVYGYWSALYLSFFSQRLYVDVGKRWKGFGFLYLFFSICLFSIPTYIQMSEKLAQQYKEITEPLLKIPTCYVQNGMLLFDKPMPYKITNSKNQPVIIIDTTGTVNNFNQKYPELTMLINKDRISIRTPMLKLFKLDRPLGKQMRKPNVTVFNKGTNAVFEGKQLMQQYNIENIKYGAYFMLYPMIVAIYFSTGMAFFLILGLLGQAFASIFFSFKLGFAPSTRLLIVAGTPMLLVIILMLSFHKQFMGSGLLLFFVLTLYYSFGIHALKAESRRVVNK